MQQPLKRKMVRIKTCPKLLYIYISACIGLPMVKLYIFTSRGKNRSIIRADKKYRELSEYLKMFSLSRIALNLDS